MQSRYITCDIKLKGDSYQDQNNICIQISEGHHAILTSNCYLSVKGNLVGFIVKLKEQHLKLTRKWKGCKNTLRLKLWCNTNVTFRLVEALIMETQKRNKRLLIFCMRICLGQCFQSCMFQLQNTWLESLNETSKTCSRAVDQKEHDWEKVI